MVSRAQIFVSNQSLSSVFSQKLQKSGSKIKDFEVLNSNEGATLKGRSGSLFPYASLSKALLQRTDVRSGLTARSIKADGVPVKELLTLVGAELNSILQLKGMPGIKVEEDALSFSPEYIANLKGHITSVATTSQGLTLTYAPEL